jgi:hypothetical protein
MDTLVSSFAFTFNLRRYMMVAIQEAERMNILTAELKRSLAELDLGLKGDLTMSDPMEQLMMALATVRRCRLIVSKPVLKAPMVSALETVKP